MAERKKKHLEVFKETHEGVTKLALAKGQSKVGYMEKLVIAELKKQAKLDNR